MSDELKIKLLVVDDEQSIRRLCMTIGASLGYTCDEAESAETAAARLETNPPDLVLTDLKLPNQSGVELLKQIKTVLPRTEVAIMTGHGSIESAVDAMKLGAYDYIEKPFRVEKMRLLLQRMAEKVRLVQENAIEMFNGSGFQVEQLHRRLNRFGNRLEKQKAKAPLLREWNDFQTRCHNRRESTFAPGDDVD